MKKEKIKRIEALLEECDMDTLDAIYMVVGNITGKGKNSIVREFIEFMNRLFE